MVRVCLIALLTFLALCASFWINPGSDCLAQGPVPLRITKDPGADLAPAIAVHPDGRVAISWQHYAADGSQAYLDIAESPEFKPFLVAPLSPSPARPSLVYLSAAGGLQIAWTQPATDTLAVWRYTWPPTGSGATEALTLPLNLPLDLTLDGRGNLHAIWAQGNALNYWEESQAVTRTVAISPALTIEGLSLAVDGAGIPHLAWSARDELANALGISYTLLISEPTPIPVTSQGGSPRLLVGPSGRAHLFWLDGGGLSYAHSGDWASARVIMTAPLSADAFAFAVGPGEVAHVVWAEAQTLWYANSADWQGSLRPLVRQVNVSKVSMVVDGRGRPHIAWSALDEEGNADIYYLCPVTKDLQLNIAYPIQGEMLTGDVLAKAEANLLSSDLLRVEFYLQADGPDLSSQKGDVLFSLGVDRDGRDGWSVPLHIADLEGNRSYRVLGLGVDLHGRMTKALGGWFTVHPKATPWVWLQAPESVARGEQASVAALAGSNEGRLRRLDLFFAPAGCSLQGTEDTICPLLPQSLYVGSYSPSADRLAAQWQNMIYDSRRLADGLYQIVVVATDRSARVGYGLSSTPLVIDNAMFPVVEVTSPQVGAVVSNLLRASARASDLDGVITRLDFYAERARPLLQASYRGQDYELDVPDLVWLGSDVDGSDGWAVRVLVDERLDAPDWIGGWRIRAVAFDDSGLATSALSPGTFAILGRDRPQMEILSPLPRSTLYLTATIKLSVPTGLRYLSRVQVYVEDLAARLTYLGEMREASGLYLYEWDTRAFPDGECTLVIVGNLTDGHKSVVRSGRLSVRNESPLCDLASPAPDPVGGQVLKGTVPISLTQLSPSLPIAEARFYYKDEAGQLRPIGQDGYKENGWSATWDTTTSLDGTYDLVAGVVDAAGHTSFVTREVTVCNVTPSISFLYFNNTLPWQGVKQISWKAESPMGPSLSVTVAYSPDDGNHWITLGQDIPAADSFVWNTAAYPDSVSARLRLIVTDGDHYGQVTSPPFMVNNINEPPSIMLLAPSPAPDLVGGQAGQIHIAWQARDPDGEALTIDLDYRRGNGDWLALARQQPNTGSYVWQTQEMPAAGDYALRVTAVDPAGATGSDVVEGVRLVPGNPPFVRLLSPHGGVRLEKETVILWQATAAGGEELWVDLYYSDNAGQTWLPLAEGLPNTGYYAWEISYLPAGSQYRVRVVARSQLFQAVAESEGVFSVGGRLPQQVTLLSPLAGSSLSDIQCVRWSVSNPEGVPLHASLLISFTGRADWSPLAVDFPDDGFYLWDTRGYPDGIYGLRVTISDGLSLASATLPQPLIISNHSNHAPHVELVSPQGDEHWSGLREVLWRAWDIDGDVLTATLSLGTDGGEEWTQIATLDARERRYLWDTQQAPPAREYLLRIVVSDSQTIAEDTTRGVFHLLHRQNHPPQVRFISPDAQGKLLRGSIVTWVAEDADDDPLTLSLAMSDDGGASWRDVAGSLFNAGEYVLDSSSLSPGQSYRLRLRANDGTYEVQALSAPFKLTRLSEQPPEIKVLSPQGGEKWSYVREVRWQASDPMEQSLRVDVEFSQDGGQNWSTLARGLASTESYVWDTRSMANGTYLLRLTADNGQARSSEMSEPFTLSNPGQNAPVISMVCPRGGEVWAGTREIIWRALDADGDPITTTLFYSVDMRNTWHALAQGILNTESYVWDTTTIPNCDHVWLKATASDRQFWSTDSCDGPFAVRNPHAPLVELLAPRGGEHWVGAQRIVWATAQQGSRPIRVKLEASFDAGQTWKPLAANLPPQGSYLWDTSALSEDSQAILRVTASDGLQSAIDFSDEPLIVRGGRPRLNLPFYLP